MRFKITSVGNAGVVVSDGKTNIYIDSFFTGTPAMPAVLPVSPDSMILVTHRHWDHFNADLTARAAKNGTNVIGPSKAINMLAGKIPAGQLTALDPEERSCGPADSAKTKIGSVTVTAFRTFHSHGHNSYLVETPSFRIFHDGDNEKAQWIDASSIGKVDALFICPWRGSDCTGFIRALSPSRWFVIHLTDEELEEYEAGTFLKELMPFIPPGATALKPGQEMEMP